MTVELHKGRVAGGNYVHVLIMEGYIYLVIMKDCMYVMIMADYIHVNPFCGDFGLDVIGFTSPLSLGEDYALLGFTPRKSLL